MASENRELRILAYDKARASKWVRRRAAQGGNGAIETAAALVNNLLLKLMYVPGEKWLSESDVENISAKTQETRFASAVAAMEQGRQTKAASIKDTFIPRIFVDWFFPNFG